MILSSFSAIILRIRKRRRGLYFPANFNIVAKEVFVVSPEGKGLGVMTREEAINQAQEAGLDLVLVNQKADPPIAKIVDFKKFLYEEKKKRQEARRKKGKGGEFKKLRLQPNTAPHDLEVRVKRAREFLEEGSRVKFIVQFRGRQITHKEVGEEKLNMVLEKTSDLAEIEKEPWYEGKRLMIILKPK